MLVAVLTALVWAAPSTGQQATISASVEVRLPPATGTGLRTLDFGVVTPGSPTQVFPDAALSGWFQLVNVGRNKDVQLTFTFPTFLTAGTGATMPAYFDGPYVQSCGNGCQTHTVSPTPLGATTMTADVVHVRPIPFGANPRDIDVFVGGRVEPAATQAAGVYQGTIQLTFAVL